MKYKVLWSQDAENQLAKLWIGAKDREVVAKAADAIDAFYWQRTL